jgi:two-component system, NarL family, nitrate/nitrite response regulator NarL
MRSVSTIVVEPRTLLREGLVSVLRHSGFKVISAVPALDKIPHAALGRASLLTIGAASETAEALEYLNRSCPPARKAKVVIITEVSGKISQPDTLKILSNGADCCIVNVRSRDVLLRSLHLAILGQWVVVVGEDGVPLDAFEAERETGSFNGHEPRMNGEHAPRINGEHASRINGEHATQYLNGGHAAQLSVRELEILKFLVAGDSNKIIARTCNLAESTVKIHLKTILRKIGVRNRTQAAIWAMQHVNGHEAA